MSESAPESIGQMIHFTRTGLSVHLDATEARVMRKGDELLLTEAVRQANTDRLGSCLFDLSASEQARRLGGQVYFLPGSAPEGFDRLEPGSQEDNEARAAAYAQADLLSDPGERRAAAAKIRQRYGSAPGARSHTIARYAGDRDSNRDRARYSDV